MFADDTNIFLSDSNLTDLVNMANAELNKISIWFKLNKLSLNIKKTNFILFSAKSSVTRDIKLDINLKLIIQKLNKFLRLNF